MVAGVAGSVLIGLKTFLPKFAGKTQFYLIAGGLFSAGVLLYLLGFATIDLGPYGGHGFSYWLSIVLAVAGAGLAIWRFTQLGGKLPGIGGLGGSGTPGAAGPQGGFAPPPAGYAPPAQPGYAQPAQPGYGAPPSFDKPAGPPPGYAPPAQPGLPPQAPPPAPPSGWGPPPQQ
jgi:hypothetical protein